MRSVGNESVGGLMKVVAHNFFASPTRFEYAFRQLAESRNPKSLPNLGHSQCETVHAKLSCGLVLLVFLRVETTLG